ncbi:hypothetical protein WDZ92_13015 [Nostoc sp. NIES-2111]
MLTDEEKLRIREEEIYRSEVRKAIEDEKPKPKTTAARAWAFVQTSFGLWVLSTIVVGLITWGYAQLQSSLQQSSAQALVAKRADTEAKSRVQQWLNMCKIQWTRNTFGGPAFEKWYFEVVKPPTKNPQYTYVIHSVYSEFEERALVSVLNQLRDNLPSSERPPIDQAIAWVGAWNPDVWTNKSFDEQVSLARQKLWLARWGSPE